MWYFFSFLLHYNTYKCTLYLQYVHHVNKIGTTVGSRTRGVRCWFATIPGRDVWLNPGHDHRHHPGHNLRIEIYIYPAILKHIYKKPNPNYLLITFFKIVCWSFLRSFLFRCLLNINFECLWEILKFLKSIYHLYFYSLHLSIWNERCPQ